MRLDFNIKVNFKFDYIFFEESSLSEEVSFTEFVDETIKHFSSDCLNSVEICNTIKSEMDYLLGAVVGGTCCDYIIRSMEVSCKTSKTAITLNGSVNFDFDEEESELSDSLFGDVTDTTDKLTKYIEDEIVEYGSIVDTEPLYLQLEEDDPIRFTFTCDVESCESKLIKE